MGHRHQAFIVARVRPHGAAPQGTPGEYQCLAAFFHNWCWDGIFPVLAVRRFITMITRRETADIARGELRQLGVQGWEPVDTSRPCPFILSLLCHAYTSSPDSPHQIFADVHHLYGSEVGVYTPPWDHGKNAQIHILARLNTYGNFYLRFLWR